MRRFYNTSDERKIWLNVAAMHFKLDLNAHYSATCAIFFAHRTSRAILFVIFRSGDVESNNRQTSIGILQ